MDEKIIREIENEVLESGVWGTMGDKSISAGKTFAKFIGANYSLFCHSNDGAYEALLRSFGKRLEKYGDFVVVGENSYPSDSLVALCVGSTPLFCKTNEDNTLNVDDLKAKLKGACMPVRAVVLDTDFAYFDIKEEYLAEVYALCKDVNVPLIINAGGNVGTYKGKKPLIEYGDALLFDFGAGSAIDVGMSGAVALNDEKTYSDVLAYHNCGRGLDDGCSLEMDETVGGDLRVSEWTCALIERYLTENDLRKPNKMNVVYMKDQPVFESNYAKKIMK